MRSHDLARYLLEREDAEIGMGVDMVSPEDDEQCVRSDRMYAVEYEKDSTVIFYFECGYEA